MLIKFQAKYPIESIYERYLKKKKLSPPSNCGIGGGILFKFEGLVNFKFFPLVKILLESLFTERRYSLIKSALNSTGGRYIKR